MSTADFGEDTYVPPTDELTAPWWDATREHCLLVQQCENCRSVQWFPRFICMSCGSRDLGWGKASGRGVVDTFTVIHRAPRAGLRTPYVLARVILAEGPVILSRIVDGDPTAIACEDPVVLAWHDLADGRALPVFRPEPARDHGGTSDGL